MVGIIIPKNIAFQKIALNAKSTAVTYYYTPSGVGT